MRAAVLTGLVATLVGSALTISAPEALAATSGLTITQVTKTVTLSAATTNAVGLDCPSGYVPLSGGVVRANADPTGLRLASEAVRTTNAVSSPNDYHAVVQLGGETAIDVTAQVVCASSDVPLTISAVTGALSWMTFGSQLATAGTVSCPNGSYALNASVDPTATADHDTTGWLVQSSPSADGTSWYALAGEIGQGYLIDVPIVVHCIASSDLTSAAVEHTVTSLSAPNTTLTQACPDGTSALAGGAYGSASGTDPDWAIGTPRMSQWHSTSDLAGRAAAANLFDPGHTSVTSVALCAQASSGAEVVSANAASGRIAAVPGASLVDGETLTISDGAGHTVTFEFSTDGTVAAGRQMVFFSADNSAADVANQIVAAVNGTSAFGTSAIAFGYAAVSLVDNAAGAAGNLPISETVSDTDFVVAGMSGGTDGTETARGAAATGLIATAPGSALADGAYFIVDDGAGQTVTFEFDTGDGVGSGRTAVVFSASDSAAVIRNKLIAAINGSVLAIDAANGGYGVVTLVNQHIGAAGNMPIISWVQGSGFGVKGMSGGHDPVSDLTVQMAHTGDFSRAQTNAVYTVTVGNGGPDATSGTVTLVDTLPTGLTATAVSGTGWFCNIETVTCTRGDALAAGGSFPVVSVMVTVAGDAPSNVANTATVSGGGETDDTNDTVTDPTTIKPAATQTAATCTPSRVRIGVLTTCVARVADAVSGVAPTGTVRWSHPSGGGTLGAASCVLVAGTGSSSCSTTYRPAKGSAGTQSIGAAYSGDTNHAASSGKVSLQVLKRGSATAATCRPKTVPHGTKTVCQATVRDTSGGQVYPPGGTVRWSAKSTYGVFSRTTCSLVTRDGKRTCHVTFTTRKSIRGQISVLARYVGDASHNASSRRVWLTVT